MIAVNGVQINLNDKNNPYAKKVNEGIKRLKELTHNDIRIEFTETRITHDPEDYRRIEKAKGFEIPMEERILHDGTDEVWTYFESKTGKGDDVKFSPRRKKFTGDWNFNSATADLGLLFYVVYISPYCETIPYLKPDDVQQNKKSTTKDYRVLMPAFDAIAKADLRKKRVLVESTIYNSINYEQMCTIGYAMGMINVEKLTDPQLRNSLCDLATSTEENMDLFLEHNKFKPKTTNDAIIQQAIEQKIIVCYKPGGKPVWKFKGEGQTQGDEIVKVIPGENEREKLLEFLDNNGEILEVIKKKLEEVTV